MMSYDCVFVYCFLFFVSFASWCSVQRVVDLYSIAIFVSVSGFFRIYE